MPAQIRRFARPHKSFPVNPIPAGFAAYYNCGMQERTEKNDFGKRATAGRYRMVVLRPDGSRQVMGDGLSFQDAWALQTELVLKHGFANVVREASELPESNDASGASSEIPPPAG
jgi:hypothetical protein